MKKLAIIAALALAAAGCATRQPVPVLVDGTATGETYTPPACTGTAERILVIVLDALGGTGTATPTGPRASDGYPSPRRQRHRDVPGDDVRTVSRLQHAPARAVKEIDHGQPCLLHKILASSDVAALGVGPVRGGRVCGCTRH